MTDEIPEGFVETEMGRLVRLGRAECEAKNHATRPVTSAPIDYYSNRYAAGQAEGFWGTTTRWQVEQKLEVSTDTKDEILDAVFTDEPNHHRTRRLSVVMASFDTELQAFYLVMDNHRIDDVLDLITATIRAVDLPEEREDG